MTAIKEVNAVAIATFTLNVLRTVLMGVVAIPFFGSIWLGFSHVVGWLKLGEWPQYSTANLFSEWGVGYPNVAWKGVQAIFDFIMSAPAFASLFGAAVVLGLIFSPLGEPDWWP